MIRIDSAEMCPNKQSQLIFNIRTKVIQKRKDHIFQQCKKKQTNLNFTPHVKNSPIWIRDLNVKLNLGVVGSTGL